MSIIKYSYSKHIKKYFEKIFVDDLYQVELLRNNNQYYFKIKELRI